MITGNEQGEYRRVNSATTTVVSGVPAVLLGFYVASTTGGTITLYDNASAAIVQVTGTITPAVGWHKLPASFGSGIVAVTANTIDVTFVYSKGN